MCSLTVRSWVLCGLVGSALIMGRPAAAAQAEVPALVLRNANLIDGISSKPKRGVTLVLRGGRIVSVTTGQGPAGAKVIDLGGRWVLPGLIDMHVHLRDTASAQRALRAGVTTARSMGAEHWVDVGLRELHRGGAADVPEVVVAGYQVTRFPSNAMFVDAPQLRSLYQSGDHVKAFREIVRINVGRRVDVIKVMASQRAGLVDQDPTQRMLTDTELAVAGAEAHRSGLPVAAHSHTDEGARAATLAGARTIEHGTMINDATLRLMRQRNVCLVPTIAGWGLQLDGINDNPVLSARAQRFAPLGRDTTMRAVRIGVTVAAGSDTRYDGVARISLVDEVIELTRTGLTPMRAIQAATSRAAECLGIERRTGTIKAGYEADVIVVETDPTLDLTVLRNPRMVINDGQLVATAGQQ